MATVLFTIAQTQNDRASEFQLVNCIYLLACGASHSLSDVLNHAGFTLSYSLAMKKIKELGKEQIAKACRVVCEEACLTVWDNVNIAYRKAEQQIDSKDHFNNGTTFTIISMHGVPYGSIPLSDLPPRLTRRITYNINPLEDILPSEDQGLELERMMLWHIEDILLTAFPDLQAQFCYLDLQPPSVRLVPIRKTEQYPLPAALINESTIDGTLDVIDHIFIRTLKLTEDEVKAHGPFISASDQLSISLTDIVTFSMSLCIYRSTNLSTTMPSFISHSRLVAGFSWLVGRTVLNDASPSPWTGYGNPT